MSNKLKFSLQLFGEDDGAGAEGTVQKTEEQVTSTGDSGGTILGDLGKDTGGNPNLTQSQETKVTTIPETYDFSAIVPEGVSLDEQALNQYTELAKSAGLSQEMASKLGAFGINLQQQAYQAAQQERVETIKAFGEQAKQTLGSEFEPTVNLAAKGLEVLERQIPELRQALNETGAGNHVAVIRAMSLIGKMVAENNGAGLGGVGAGGGDVYSSMYPNTNFDKY